MFTGELPFSADTPLAVLRQHIEVTPPSVRQARADLSPALASVVERCLAKDAARRYQTPLELAQALAQALPGAIPVRAPEPVPPAPTTATGSQPTASGTTPASTAPATETPVGSKFCIKCGAGLTPGHKYCVACGAPASGASPAPETPVAAPPAVGRPQTPTPPPPPPPKATPATQPAAPPPAPPTRRGGFPWRLLLPVAGVAGVALIFILISSSGGDGGGGGFVPFPATSTPTPTAALVPVATVALAVTAVPAVTAAPAPTPTPRHPQRVEVGADVDAQPLGLLGGHVMRSAHDRTGTGHSSQVYCTANAEIGDLGHARLVDQDVLWLDVTVYGPPLMYGGQTQCDSVCDNHSSVYGHTSLCSNEIVEAQRKVLQGHEIGVTLLVHSKDADNIGMRDRCS